MHGKHFFMWLVISVFLLSSVSLALFEDDPNLVAWWKLDGNFLNEINGEEGFYVGGDPCWVEGAEDAGEDSTAIFIPDSRPLDSGLYWINGGGSWGWDDNGTWIDFDVNDANTYPGSWNPNDSNTWDYNDVYTWADIEKDITITFWIRLTENPDTGHYEQMIQKGSNDFDSVDQTVDPQWDGGSIRSYWMVKAETVHCKWIMRSEQTKDSQEPCGKWGEDLGENATWHFICGVYDYKEVGEGGDGVMTRYYDGEHNDDPYDPRNIPAGKKMDLTDTDVLIGHCYGMFDDVRIYNRAFSAREIAAMYGLINLNQAWGEVPEDKGIKDPIAPLTFKAGDKTSSNDRQEVYISSNYEDVNSASTSDPIGAVRLDPNLIMGPDAEGNYSLDAAALGLSLGATYYWRVDDYNAAEPNMWKGNIWEFEVAPYYVIDDFESYGSENELKSAWPGEGSGFVYLEGDGGTETITIDELSLHITNFFGSYGGASIAPPLPQTDWSEATGIGVKSLWVSFYGISTNPAAPIYAYIEDGSNGYYVHHPDPNAAKAGQWKLWRIDLKDFTDQGLDLSNITKLAVGIGDRSGGGTGIFADVYFDNIRIYVPVCVPEIRKPVADVNNYRQLSDCAVDNTDLGLLSRDWLKYSYSATSVVPSNDDLELYYSFTGDDLQDDSGNSRDGQARNALKDPADANYYQTTTALYEDGPDGFGRCLVFTNAPEADDPNSRFYIYCGGERADVPALGEVETDIDKWPDPDGDPNFWPNNPDVWPNAWDPCDSSTWPNPDWVENFDSGDSNTWPDYDPSDPLTIPGMPGYHAPTDANFNDADWPDGWDIATPSTWWNPADANTFWDPNDFITWADIDDEITLACWVKITEPYGVDSAKNKFITKGWTGAYSLNMAVHTHGMDPNEGKFSLNKQGSSIHTHVPMNDETAWYHLAGTYDGKEQRVYVNGALGEVKFITIDSLINHDFTDPIRLGTRGEQLDYAGFLDEVRVYSRVLSHGEIMNLAGMAPGTVMQVELPQPGLDLSADGMINFKDYAVLMQEWLVGPLKWPTW